MRLHRRYYGGRPSRLRPSDNDSEFIVVSVRDLFCRRRRQTTQWRSADFKLTFQADYSAEVVNRSDPLSADNGHCPRQNVMRASGTATNLFLHERARFLEEALGHLRPPWTMEMPDDAPA
jgi:hypothetical protein